MPRGKQRRTQSGEEAQNIGSVPGRRYGEGVAQQAMQRAMPAPDRTGVPSPQPGSPVPASPGGSPAPPPDAGAALAAAPLGLLSGGSQRPNQPVTAGLSSGPGGGPEMLGSLRARTPLSRTLENLYQRTGDETFGRLMRKAMR